MNQQNMMSKVGAAIAVIGGALGMHAGIFILVLGGTAVAFTNYDANTVFVLGWSGVGLSILVIALGIITLQRRRFADIGLILCALTGIVLVGKIVGAFLVPALIGGIVCLVSNVIHRTFAS